MSMQTDNEAQSPLGFRAAGIHCGLKAEGAKDLALIVSEKPCQVFGVFTTNKIKAAPVLYDMGIVADGKPVRAVVANAGVANACTGEQGLKNTAIIAETTAAEIDCHPDEVLVLSTGVIGVQLPIEKLVAGIKAAVGELAVQGWRAASQAIMTTDTRPKLFSHHSEQGYTIIGVAKGAGMIAPNMATMLSVITTDAPLTAGMGAKIHEIWNQTYNRIVVDGDMSTNDTVLLLANGAAEIESFDEEQFMADFFTICESLAKAIVSDGEGATKLVEVLVDGASSEQEAAEVARAIATSPLCKTAFYGADPNWGRIVCAAGYSGADIQEDSLRLWLEDETANILLFEHGQPADYDEQQAQALMAAAEWRVHLDLGNGQASSWVWTCDLSHEYVTINGHYRT